MRQAAVDSQRRRVAQTAAAGESDRDNLTKTTVASPWTGVVTLLQKEEGETWPYPVLATVIMTVADLSVMRSRSWSTRTDIRDSSW